MAPGGDVEDPPGRGQTISIVRMPAATTSTWPNPLRSNGPRGGKDKRCCIQVPFPGTRNVVIEDTEADLYVAIDRAADRAARAVSRRLERASGGRRDASSAGDAGLITE